MIVLTCEQRSAEWYSARCGVPSASNFDRIVTSKGEVSKQRQKYLYQLAGEKVSGITKESFQSAAMANGIELEDEARKMYMLVSDSVVEEAGFCKTEGEIEAGCSPDGLVGEIGGLEIKCPNVETHVEYLLENKLPTEYFQQVQGSLFVTGREWWDFMSYSPGIKPLIIRVYPDVEFHKKLRIELTVFCKELTEIINKIK